MKPDKFPDIDQAILEPDGLLDRLNKAHYEYMEATRRVEAAKIDRRAAMVNYRRALELFKEAGRRND